LPIGFDLALSQYLGLGENQNRQLAIENALGYQTSGSAQRLPCEPRQAGNGATVATAACVAGKSEVWPIGKKERQSEVLLLSLFFVL
jgi:hypothetical protein